MIELKVAFSIINQNPYIWSMKKLFLSHIMDDIEYKAEKSPQPLELTNIENIAQPYYALENERIQWNYYKLSTKKKVRDANFVKMTKYRVIRLMGDVGIFDAQLATDLNITREDLVLYRSKMFYIKDYIKNKTETEWKESVLERGKKECLEEEKATNEYYQKYNEKVDNSVLRTILAQGKFPRNNPAPRYVTERSLNKCSTEIIEKHQEKKLLAIQHAQQKISTAKFTRKNKELTQDIIHLLRDKKKAYKNMFKNKKSNIRMVFIRALPHESSQHVIPPIILVTSWRHGKDLIANYRNWFNEKYAEEIKQAKIENKKKSDISYYNSKPNVSNKRNSKKEQQQKFAEYIAEGFSQAEAGRLVGIGSSTANRWANNPKICQISPNN